jgi:hypothetical protein
MFNPPRTNNCFFTTAFVIDIERLDYELWELKHLVSLCLGGKYSFLVPACPGCGQVIYLPVFSSLLIE